MDISDKLLSGVRKDVHHAHMAHKFKENKKNGSLSKTPKGVNPKYPLSPVALLSSAPHSTPVAQASSSLPITTELAAPGAPTMTKPRTTAPQQQQ